MKNAFLWAILLMLTSQASAQNNLGKLLASGVEDTETFATDYLRPGTRASLYALSGGWFQTAEVKHILGFEISVIGNAAINLDDHHTFLMNTNDYRNITFADGSSEKEVASILGENLNPVEVHLNYDTPFGRESISVTLPDGLAVAGVEAVPSAFLQARLGIFRGTEIKARYFPKVAYDKVEAALYGAGLQHEFTSWIGDDLPFAVSGLVAYTKMTGAYDMTEENYLEGDNQLLKTDLDSWLFSGIVSTNLPVINFYGGLGYMKGASSTSMLGTYVVLHEASGEVVAEVEDPFEIVDEINGLKANLGLSLKLGFLKLHADYSFQEYEAVSAGVHFGF